MTLTLRDGDVPMVTGMERMAMSASRTGDLARSPRRRDSLRLTTYDYRSPGPYFVTLCAKSRHAIIPESRRGDLQVALLEAAAMYAVRLHVTAVADRHIHLLVTLPDDGRTSLGRWIGIAKVFSARAVMNARVGATFRSPAAGFWQRSYYDHVVRNDADFTEKARYIENHPYKESSQAWAEWHGGGEPAIAHPARRGGLQAAHQEATRP